MFRSEMCGGQEVREYFWKEECDCGLRRFKEEVTASCADVSRYCRSLMTSKFSVSTKQ
jgi:hypothetical protein